jgi:hypothetical protein
MNSSEARTREAPRQEERALTWGHAQAAIAALGALAGLSVYIYVLGGTVAWLRAVAARLPADNVTPAFESHHLVALGFKVVALETLLLLGVSLVIFAVLAIVRNTERTEIRRSGVEHRRQFNRPTADDDEDLLFALTIVFRSLLVGLLIAALASTTGGLSQGGWIGVGLLVAAAFAAIELGLRWRTSLLAPIPMREPSTGRFVAECLSRLGTWFLIAVTLCLGIGQLAAPLGMTVLVLLALLVGTHYARALRVWTGRRSYFHAGVLVGVMAALNLIIIPYLGEPPVAYERATVITSDGADHQGAYLGRTADGIYLGTCLPKDEEPDGSKRARVEVIDAEDVKQLTLGGPRYVFDVARRPTLFFLVGHFITGDALDADNDGVMLDLRHRRRTCVVDPAR